MGRGAAQRELKFFHEEEIARQRIIAIYANPAVNVMRREHDARAAFGQPVLRYRGLRSSGVPVRQAPRQMASGEADGFSVDMGVGGPLGHRLEGADWLTKLVPLRSVGRGES